MPVGFDTATRVSLKSDPAYLPHVRKIAKCMAEFAGMDEQQIDEAALVLTEAYVNAVRHGSPNGAEDNVMITLRSSSQSIIADVTDSGKSSKIAPSDFGSDSFGLKIMRMFAHSVRFIKRRSGLTVKIMMNARRHRRFQ